MQPLFKIVSKTAGIYKKPQDSFVKWEVQSVSVIIYRAKKERRVQRLI